MLLFQVTEEMKRRAANVHASRKDYLLVIKCEWVEIKQEGEPVCLQIGLKYERIPMEER